MSAIAQSSLASFEAPPFPAPPEVPTLSEARLRANRANARKSTGPRTAEGKRRSSENALVHGLRAASILLPGEDPRDLLAYRDSIIRTTNPRNPIEMEYVEQVIRAGWKLRRFQAAEADAIEAHSSELEKQGPDSAARPGAALASALQDRKFHVFPRYEQQYARMMNRALDELRKLKKDPIYGILGDFCGEMLEEERLHRIELERDDRATDCAPGDAPNEPKPQPAEISDEAPEGCSSFLDPINKLTRFEDIKAALEARLVTAPEPAEAG